MLFRSRWPDPSLDPSLVEVGLDDPGPDHQVPVAGDGPRDPVDVGRLEGGHLAERVAAELPKLEFGKFRGHTLGQVAAFEPTYIDWIARTITRDRDLVVKARVIQADLDERGIERRVRPSTLGFGGGRGPDD